MLRSVVLVVLVLLALLAASPALAGPARPTRAAVEARLRAHELPPPPAEWRALGAGVDEVLVEIGADDKVEVLVRARAVSVLGHLSTPVARRFLEETIDARLESSHPDDRLLLRRAAVALGWMGGNGVAARLGPLLANPDPDVRLDAAIGLGLTRTAAAADLLRKRLPDEPVARVRTQLGRQIRVIEDALGAGKR